MKITVEGKQKVEAQIQDLMNELKELREEKAKAYELTGDTWHDNPYFNKLEQDERVLNTKIGEAQSILKNAEIINDTERNMEFVEIGSIVKCQCTYSNFEEVIVFEIVGHGETDVDNGKIYYESLVAKNIMGLHVNDNKSFDTPGGRVNYKILDFFESWDEVKKKEDK